MTSKKEVEKRQDRTYIALRSTHVIAGPNEIALKLGAVAVVLMAIVVRLAERGPSCSCRSSQRPDPMSDPEAQTPCVQICFETQSLASLQRSIGAAILHAGITEKRSLTMQ